MRIGPFELTNTLALAPMAGVTDLPFRGLCRELGAGMAVSEMISADTALWANPKSQRRLDHEGEAEPRVVQLLGSDPRQLAEAARINQDRGAQILDINMGCPAKKVCGKDAGAALLRHPDRIEQILGAVVSAVDAPVTVKIRTGWDPEHRNGVQIARIAEQAGVAALTVHGRTRACGFSGVAEYDTIAGIKAAVAIPVIANGDIQCPEKAKQVLAYTGADGIMVGRAAQGRPWIFREIEHFLATGRKLAEPRLEWQEELLLTHLDRLYEFYGATHGVRIARKHIAWYSKTHPGGAAFRKKINRIDNARAQRELIISHFNQIAKIRELAA